MTSLAPSFRPGAFHGDARRVATVARGVGSRGRMNPAFPKSPCSHPCDKRRYLWLVMENSRGRQAAASPDRRDPLTTAGGCFQCGAVADRIRDG